ncbi:MAG TPA: hypothetical protein VGO53_16535 [Steroidobacteraceae bacterium]|jgi:hypothetical protein|nr:hypothetical protein [Steroidobacteraceae bacterium]
MKGHVNTSVDYDIPELIAGGLTRYIEHGIPTGSFLRACLENDFVEACTRANFISAAQLMALAEFLKWEMPPLSWGSRAQVDAWIAAGEAKAAARPRGVAQLVAERAVGYLTSEHLPDGPGAQHLPKSGDDETER